MCSFMILESSCFWNKTFPSKLQATHFPRAFHAYIAAEGVFIRLFLKPSMTLCKLKCMVQPVTGIQAFGMLFSYVDNAALIASFCIGRKLNGIEET
jgi:hypothetical protein